MSEILTNRARYKHHVRDACRRIDDLEADMDSSTSADNQALDEELLQAARNLVAADYAEKRGELWSLIERGTEDDPVVVDEWPSTSMLGGFNHVHTRDGQCLKSRWRCKIKAGG